MSQKSESLIILPDGFADTYQQVHVPCFRANRPGMGEIVVTYRADDRMIVFKCKSCKKKGQGEWAIRLPANKTLPIDWENYDPFQQAQSPLVIPGRS